MAYADIKINDEYVNNMGKIYSEWCEELQKGIDNYLSIMDTIATSAIIEGETADAVKDFISYAKTLSGIVEPLGQECMNMCSNYLVEVDKADSELY